MANTKPPVHLSYNENTDNEGGEHGTVSVSSNNLKFVRQLRDQFQELLKAIDA